MDLTRGRSGVQHPVNNLRDPVLLNCCATIGHWKASAVICWTRAASKRPRALAIESRRNRRCRQSTARAEQGRRDAQHHQRCSRLTAIWWTTCVDRRDRCAAAATAAPRSGRAGHRRPHARRSSGARRVERPERTRTQRRSSIQLTGNRPRWARSAMRQGGQRVLSVCAAQPARTDPPHLHLEESTSASGCSSGRHDRQVICQLPTASPRAQTASRKGGREMETSWHSRSKTRSPRAGPGALGAGAGLHVSVYGAGGAKSEGQNLTVGATRLGP